MNISEIREIAQIMKDCGLTNIEINGENISMKREVLPVVSNQSTQTVVEIENKQENITVANPEVKEFVENKAITAPTVGVFYTSSSPDTEPYVKVGDKVESGDVLCIIEAMKLMNEIQADCSGEIVEILADNGSIVEYGQELFKIK